MFVLYLKMQLRGIVMVSASFYLIQVFLKSLKHNVVQTKTNFQQFWGAVAPSTHAELTIDILDIGSNHQVLWVYGGASAEEGMATWGCVTLGTSLIFDVNI